MELARVMATRRSEATIVFAAVAAEEQGLYGSDHLAQVFKDAGADVQAMFSNDIVGTGNAHDGTPNDPRTLRLFVEGVPTSETPRRPRSGSRWAGRTTARRANSAVSSATSPTTRRPARESG